MDNSKISRELITAFGEKILSNKEVECVHMTVSFKDGSNIAFNKGCYDDKGEEGY